jgi:SprT protein
MNPWNPEERDNCPQSQEVAMRLALEETQKKAIREAAAAFYARIQMTPAPEVRFDLHGRAAGQWRIRAGVEMLRFNPEAFLRDWHDHFPATVAHEVAHSLVYRKCGIGTVRPHGPEWRALMVQLGFPPQVTHRTPLTGRRTRAYLYQCRCRSHQLGPRRHYLVTRTGYRYACTRCGDTLEFRHQVQWREQGS